MKRWLTALVCVLLVIIWQLGMAETLLLPEELLRVEEAAFAGNKSIQQVCAPAGLQWLDSRAFADCTSLMRMTVTGTDTQIAADCFDGCPEELLLECLPGSEAMNFAQSHFMDYDADTVCRALILCQTYVGTPLATISGTGNDAQAVASMLAAQTERSFQVITAKDQTADEILTSIEQSFAAADESDISFVYYLGHGRNDGALIGYDGKGLAPGEVRAAMARIPGRKLLIVDACYSGHFVQDNDDEAQAYSISQEDGAAAFTAAWMQAFGSGMRSRAAGGDDLWVIASAAPNEQCYETNIRKEGIRKVMGCFTYMFCVGCGWNGVTEKPCEPGADANGNGAISVAEAFDYAREGALNICPYQHAQSNAAGCVWFAPFR